LDWIVWMIEVEKKKQERQRVLIIRLSGFRDGRGREAVVEYQAFAVARPTPSAGVFEEMAMTCRAGRFVPGCAGCRSQESCTEMPFLAACKHAWTFTTRSPKKRDERRGRRAV
jgi:hypothetical protein